MRVFQRRDGTVRILVVAACAQFVLGFIVPVVLLRAPISATYWPSLALMLALIPLDDRQRRGWSWRQNLRSWPGVLAAGAGLVWVVVFVQKVLR